MGLFLAVDDAEGVLATWREEEIVSADRIVDDAQHHVATVRVQRIAFGEVDAASVVESTS